MSKQEEQGRTFFGGVPTAPDVKHIRDEFPDDQLKAGTFISYKEIEDVITVNRDRSRFRTVTTAWRKTVENEAGVVIQVKPTEGFIVLSEGEKADFSGQKLREAGRKARRGYKVACMVDRRQLNEEERARLDHNKTRAAAVLAAQQMKTTRSLPEM